MVGISCGGHPLPLLVRRDSAPETVGYPGTLVGALATPVFHETDVRFGAGDTMILYTDGATDGRRNGEFYGTDRLLSVITTHLESPATLVDSVLADLMRFQAGDARDDIVVLAIRAPAVPS